MRVGDLELDDDRDLDLKRRARRDVDGDGLLVFCLGLLRLTGLGDREYERDREEFV